MAPDPAAAPSRYPPGTLRMGRIAGIDITVRASWLLIAGLIAWMLAPTIRQVAPGLDSLAYVAGLAFAVLLYLSVLLHELSHALAAKAFGLPVRSVTLHFLGGVTEIDEEPQTPWREFVVSVVGPLTSLLVGGVAWLLASALPHNLLGYAVRGLASANLIVGLLNLAPGLPLDGGRVLRAAVWGATGKPHLGTQVAAWAGRVLAVLVLAYPLALQVATSHPPDLYSYAFALIVAMFLWTSSSQALVGARLRAKLPALHARALARRAVGVPHDLPLAEGIRRARGAQAGALVVVSGVGEPIGIVNEVAVWSTPEDRRPWVSCGSVARRLEPGMRLDADLTGERLVSAMREAPATEYVLLDTTGGVFGVLAAKDVDAAFAAA